jgi:hypothetical protein
MCRRASFCVLALARLKVAATGRFPLRNRWKSNDAHRRASIVPSAVPQILGEDAEAGAFAMAFRSPVPGGRDLSAGDGTVAMAGRMWATPGASMRCVTPKADLRARSD